MNLWMSLNLNIIRYDEGNLSNEDMLKIRGKMKLIDKMMNGELMNDEIECMKNMIEKSQ